MLNTNVWKYITGETKQYIPQFNAFRQGSLTLTKALNYLKLKVNKM